MWNRKVTNLICRDCANRVSSWLSTSLGVLEYSFTLSTETMLFSISVQERTIQFRTPVI